MRGVPTQSTHGVLAVVSSLFSGELGCATAGNDAQSRTTHPCHLDTQSVQRKPFSYGFQYILPPFVVIAAVDTRTHWHDQGRSGPNTEISHSGTVLYHAKGASTNP